MQSGTRPLLRGRGHGWESSLGRGGVRPPAQRHRAQHRWRVVGRFGVRQADLKARAGESPGLEEIIMYEG